MARVLRIIAGALSFAYLIVVLNLVQVASFILLPISRKAVRRINRWCARSIWGMWVLMAERQNGIEVRVTGDAILPRENALVLSNHQSMSDVLLLLCMGWRARRLGDMKWFVKNVVKFVPGPGVGMWLLDCIFLARDWLKDRKNIDTLFRKYKAEQIPLFLVSFLEGTRLTPKKLAAAQAFARERGHYVPKHTLVPRTKGFVFTVTGLRQHLDSVYDVTIGYETAPPPSLFNCFAGDVKRLDLHVRRYDAASLPTDEEALATWALDRFREKDELLEARSQAGRFPGAEISGKVTVKEWLTSEAVLPAWSADAPVSEPAPASEDQVVAPDLALDR
jgi:1-acyl-sn-glycerol-3-phosphate acyltransferase